MVTSAFPPDDRSYGWEVRYDRLEGMGSGDHRCGHRDGCLRFRESERASRDTRRRDGSDRRNCASFADGSPNVPSAPPLSEGDEKAAYIDRQFEMGREPELAVKRVVLLVLKSPRFLYPRSGRHVQLCMMSRPGDRRCTWPNTALLSQRAQGPRQVVGDDHEDPPSYVCAPDRARRENSRPWPFLDSSSPPWLLRTGIERWVDWSRSSGYWASLWAPGRRSPAPMARGGRAASPCRSAGDR